MSEETVKADSSPLTLIIEKLEQLQAHKDKEDKLREYMKNYLKVEEDEYNYNVKCEFNELLQILDGSDE